jgi:hypothetical protein
LLEKAGNFTYAPDEVYLNLCLHKWLKGELFDDEFCRQIKKKLSDKLTAQWICLVFRRALGLPIIH